MKFNYVVACLVVTVVLLFLWGVVVASIRHTNQDFNKPCNYFVTHEYTVGELPVACLRQLVK